MKEKDGKNGGKLKVREKGDAALPGAGRPEGSPNVSTKFKRFLEGETEWTVKTSEGERKIKITREEALMFRLFQIAEKGDVTKSGESSGVSIAAIKELHDRAHGKPPQQTELTGKDGDPLQIDFNPSALTTDEKRAMLALIEKAKNG